MGIKAFMSGLGERVRGVFYEGPKPPARLGQLVREFARLNQYATRAEWIAFAIEHGEECYQSGYTRGFEYKNRDKDAAQPDYDWEWTEDPSAVPLLADIVVDEAVPNEPPLEQLGDEELALYKRWRDEY